MKDILGNVDCRQVLDLIPHMVIIVGSDGEVLFRNKVLADYLGELSDERQWQSNIHPDDREKIKNGFIKGAVTGESFEQLARIKRSDGVYRWFFGKFIPIKSTEGQVKSWIATATDCDELKKYRDNLESSLGRIENILDCIPLPLVVFDVATGRAKFTNKAIREGGYQFPIDTPTDDQNTHYLTDMNGHRIKSTENPRSLVRKGKTVDGLAMGWHSPTRQIWLLTSTVILPEVKGLDREALLMWKDVTELRTSKDRLAKLIEEKDDDVLTYSKGIRAAWSDLVTQVKKLESLLMDEIGHEDSIEPLTKALDHLHNDITKIKSKLDALQESTQSKRE